MEEMGTERRRLVVIGGGIAGSLLAKSLWKENFEITWASLRTMVEPSSGERSVINRRDNFTNGRIVTSTAIGINKTEVLRADDRSIAYDYLVIATGHRDPVPKTRKERLKEYQAATATTS